MESAGPALALAFLRQLPDGLAGLDVEGAEEFLRRYRPGPPRAAAARIAAAGPPLGRRVLVKMLQRSSVFT